MPRSIHTRLSRLESVVIPADYCATCGDPGTVVLRVIVTTNHDPLPTCNGCGRSLDQEGRPLPKVYKRVIFAREDGNPIRDAVAPD